MTLKENVDLSIIVPFRNRELDRLTNTVTTLKSAVSQYNTEIIISDYGSDEIDELVLLSKKLNVSIFHKSANYWNKPDCLNSAIAISKGKNILCADADMLWRPGSLARALESIERLPQRVIAFQTRDLPASISSEDIDLSNIDWEALESCSSVHSRWGNGVLLFSRETFDRVGGYDQRLHTYGVEDLDFCKRAQKAGSALVWRSEGFGELFHVWHAPVAKSNVTAVKRAVNRNRDIYQSDHSVVRNTLSWSGERLDARPLVSVVLCTRDRSSLLQQAIWSVLAQSMQDFEIIVVDDGSTDDTAAVVESFNESRVRYFYQDHAGISAARNRAAIESKGLYTAVMDDDDLMPVWRLERQLAALVGGVHGVVGSFVSFDDSTGELTSWADPMPTSIGAFAVGGFAGHPTWMVETDLVRKFGYDESFTSAVDNNIALRMLRAGVKFVHCGEVLNLRRVHNLQITATDGSFQSSGARLNRAWHNFQISAEQGREIRHEAKKAGKSKYLDVSKQANRVYPFLPDHLVTRRLIIEATSEEALASLQSEDHKVRILMEELDDTGKIINISGVLEDATWADLAKWGSHGAIGQIIAVKGRFQANRGLLKTRTVKEAAASLAKEFSAALWRSDARAVALLGRDLLRTDRKALLKQAEGTHEYRSYRHESEQTSIDLVAVRSFDEAIEMACRFPKLGLEILTNQKVAWTDDQIGSITNQLRKNQ